MLNFLTFSSKRCLMRLIMEKCYPRRSFINKNNKLMDIPINFNCRVSHNPCPNICYQQVCSNWEAIWHIINHNNKLSSSNYRCRLFIYTLSRVNCEPTLSKSFSTQDLSEPLGILREKIYFRGGGISIIDIFPYSLPFNVYF